MKVMKIFSLQFLIKLQRCLILMQFFFKPELIVLKVMLWVDLILHLKDEQIYSKKSFNKIYQHQFWVEVDILQRMWLDNGQQNHQLQLNKNLISKILSVLMVSLPNIIQIKIYFVNNILIKILVMIKMMKNIYEEFCNMLMVNLK